MDYVGLKVVRKDFGGRAASFGTVVAFSTTTGLFRVAFDGGDESEEMQLTELYPLFLTPPPPGFGQMPLGKESSVGIGADLENPRDSGRNFDLNVSGDIDLNVDVDGGGGVGLHGLDLNEGVNYILNGETDSTPKSRETDLNLDLNEAAQAEESSTTSAKIDLNEQASAMEIDDRGKAAAEDDDDDCAIIPAPSHHVGGGSSSGGRGRWRRNYRTNPDAESRRLNAMPSFPARDNQLYVANTRLMQFQASAPPPPPKAYLPESSTSLDIGGASMVDFLSVYAFVRYFSVTLLVSPFQISDFAAALMSNDSTPLFDAVHLALMTALRSHLTSLADGEFASASACLRSLNWDLLDLITWPVFLIEYLLFHSPKHIPGLDRSEFKLFQSEYYAMPAPAKVAILRHLCDDVLESKAFKAEADKRALMAETQSWNSRYFSWKGKKNKRRSSGGDGDDLAGEFLNDFVADGNGDECYLCKTDGNLICCDGCPAAFHARCVGVVTSQLPVGDWICPECTIERDASYQLSKSIRGMELLGVDAYARHYYNCCGYLFVADSREDNYWFSLYNKDDMPAVVAALETSSTVYDVIASAIRRNWNLTLGVSSEVPEDTVNPRDEGAGSGASTSSSELANYANLYGFARMSYKFSKELASKWSEEEQATKSAGEIIGRQMRVISNKYAAFSWPNLRDLGLATTRRENCGWCICCKVPQLEKDCLFIASDNVQASENFTSQALGIMPGSDSRKIHLVDIICHLIWIEECLRSLLSGPWLDQSYSGRWRNNAVEAAHIGSLKHLLIELASNLPRRVLSGDWTKSVDNAATMGSSSHTMKKFTTRVSRLPADSRGKRKCPKSKLARTPKEEQGVSLSWWRGGKASRKLFNWKTCGIAGGCKKIDGVSYPDGGDYAKRTKGLAWSAAVEASKTVEQLALQVRLFDASIKWNAVGIINLHPEPKKDKQGRR
ncbi:DDT domain-containing protein PTM-like [Salvia splendens]|uniref:DDT domain-containing protein PTM-like n=1 Tax=Salvia splendens TaxID=180675 RepID=UPI001C2749C2|nr:DDT domain-containing protein PTM-like [Salvia splendens]